MLFIHLTGPWASAVVLIWKKDGKLQFFIDLRRLNAQTVNDAYSPPWIDETLDCLNDTVWFMSLDLKSGYLQVEMEDDTKALICFHHWAPRILQMQIEYLPD